MKYGHRIRHAIRIAVMAVIVIGTSLTPDAPASAVTSSPQRGAGFTIDAPTTTLDLSVFDRQIDRVAREGGKWVRFGAPAVHIVQEWGVGDRMRFQDGALDVLDRALDRAAAKGLQVYFITTDSYNYHWAGTDRDTYQDVMQTYWSKLSERFADKVNVWQVFNEPDGLDYVTGGPREDGDTGYFDRLAADLGLARDTIRAINPNVLVTTNPSGYPAGAEREQTWIEFFDTMGDSVDAISVSAYPTVIDNDIAALPARLERLGDRYNKPVIIAEIGLQTCAGCYSEDTQGTYVAKAVDSIATADVLATFVYELQDKGTDGEGTFGSLRIDGTAKSGAGKIFASVANY